MKNIREHVTQKLETDVKLFYKFTDSSGVVRIEESDSNTKKSNQDLVLVKLNNIPQENIWIFENEFYQNKYPNLILDGQKGAFSSAGYKVEKTVLWHYEDKLFLFMFEMKTTMSIENFSKVKDKFEGSLSTISIFIASHSELSELLDTTIYPVGICCYNYEDMTLTRYYSGSEAKETFKTKYIEDFKREFNVKVEPLALTRLYVPVIFYRNHTTPVTTGFEIDFQDILDRLATI
ncbi:hypothetical protein VB776_19290 [Arcicella sp. DC2W]|uniref:Uncharacterized protein n=1 Tax=Arcicella gelida TaxID=2984195 RepID=A0ABU5S9D9_9BACT|nr:hypothetical protein [Arcicella sp. DC2W]MEA5405088.1 hypothetical protein [Arcicella sp. DC2W]